jgi:hypothetical protein
MTTTDWAGSIGVAILLLAFFLNLSNRIAKDSATYLLLNLLGAGIACYASALLPFWPFVILEGCWFLVSAYGLFVVWKKNS